VWATVQAGGERGADVRDSPQMILTLLPTLMQEAACSHAAGAVVADADAAVAVVVAANLWDAAGLEEGPEVA